MTNAKDGSTPEEQERMLQEQALREQSQYDTVSCEVCLKEVPKSLAHTEDAEDYVRYFCGLDCIDKWAHQKNSDKK